MATPLVPAARGRGCAGGLPSSAGSSTGLVTRQLGSLLQGPQGFEEPQGDVAMGGILPGQQRDLLPEDGEVQGPVDEQ